jgi:hypothetical protein
MKPASTSAYALMLAAAFFAGKADQASALPVLFVAGASQDLVLPVACKYGSGKCADVNPVHQAPSTEKHGPQDPTVDPDCKAYGNCHNGPNGGPAAAAKTGTTAKPNPAAIGGMKAEAVARKSGGDAPNISGNSSGHSKEH